MVADEVRKLAERTTKSTREIAQMITRIQRGTQHAVDNMNIGVAQVASGVDLAAEATEAAEALQAVAGKLRGTVEIFKVQ